MNTPQFILTPFGILFIIIGILQQQRGFAEWNIRWSNSLKGTKTEITKQSILAQRITGIILVIIGIILLIMAYFVIPSITTSTYNQ